MQADVVFWLANLAQAEERRARGLEEARRAEWRRSDLAGLLAEASAAADETRARREAESRAARDLEGQLQDREAALARLRRRERQLQAERELEALRREIATTEAEIDALEAEALRRIEAADGLLKEIARRDAEADGCRQRLAAEEAELAAAAAHGAARAEAEAAEAVTCEEQLPPDVAAAVKRLRGGGAVPVARLRDGGCGGCGALLPLQQAMAVEQGRATARCPACGRFLVAPA